MARRADPRLRLTLITDGLGDPNRVEQIVRAAVAGGVRCVQLREPRWTARAMLHTCEHLTPILDAVGGLLLVNDRLDVAATRVAHGAQIGHRSLPPDLAREVVGPHAMLGYSAHDREELELAAPHCSFALLSPVWPTSSKPDGPFLGVARAAQLTERAVLPVAWLGGVDEHTIGEIATLAIAQRPAGVAVRSAIMLADDPEDAARRLLAALAGTD